ncbi:MAG: oligoribonuclease [Coxiellaceae bacterium]|nr:oligoribonuclease [Coxiellaceae bacterium]
MPNNETNLAWIDLEMTGLRPEAHRIIEIATIVTTPDLEVIAEGPVFAISQPQSELDKMDQWNVEHHGRSGLTERVQKSKITEAEASQATVDFLLKHIKPGKSPICGNSICQDRRFLYEYMPQLEAFFHYRNLDVSTIKVLAQFWAPRVADAFHKVSTHQALNDIRDSIEELRHYRKQFFNCT